MRKIFLISLLLVFALAIPAGRACAGENREQKLQNDSYEKLVNKNLELRKEVDSLVKEEDQLREIYKVLLEKVKSLQMREEDTKRLKVIFNEAALKKKYPGIFNVRDEVKELEASPAARKVLVPPG